MSEVSVLSHEYKTASDLSQALDDALITVKKARLNLPGAAVIAPEDLERSRRYLADILDALLSLLTPTGSGPRRAAQSTAATRVPGSVIARLRAERQGDLPYYLEDLERVAERLRKARCLLTDRDLELLDGIAAVADSETARVFRRLMWYSARLSRTRKIPPQPGSGSFAAAHLLRPLPDQ